VTCSASASRLPAGRGASASPTRAVATSGTSERGHHIIDPHTGRPPTALASITLVGEHLTTIDAVATAAFAMGEHARDWTESLPACEAFAVTPDGGTWQTSGFHAFAG
jgi:thiamine biosynthesis lipoprotein